MYILVTGGLGYIGSHIVVQLLEKSYKVVVLDNLCNSDLNVLDSIKSLTDNKDDIFFIQGDIRDVQIVNQIFIDYPIHTVIHCAALKAVAESIEYPDLYYDVNVNGTLNLLTFMNQHNVHNLIYSSSATVYGQGENGFSEYSILDENDIPSPYGKTKFKVEQILKNIISGFNITILRYFNPIGCHPSGMLRESIEKPNNLFPILLKKIHEKNRCIDVYGNDYDTKDGTCIRDFIHVEDVARAHLLFLNSNHKKTKIYNIGTGHGTSVLELITTFNLLLADPFVIEYKPRRSGDVDVLCANIDKIKYKFNFQPQYTLIDMCRHGLLTCMQIDFSKQIHFFKNNPNNETVKKIV